jgi:hypothetical protein
MPFKEKIINDSISQTLERHEDNLHNLFKKVKDIEAAQSEYKKHLQDFENGRSRNENENIELQHVKNILFAIWLAVDF